MDNKEALDEAQGQRQENEAVKSAKEILKNKGKNNVTKVIWKAVQAAIIPILIVMAKIMALFLVVLLIISLLSSILDGEADLDKTAVSVDTVWGNNFSREEFIKAVNEYNGGSYYSTYLAPYAGEFYDICSEYNINPCYAFAVSCLETDNGETLSTRPGYQLFAMGHDNDDDSGTEYSSVEESIRAFCDWVKNNSTEGTGAYNLTCAMAQEYAEVNEIFIGTPEDNIYVLFVRYSFLGYTHICDEPDFENPLGLDSYKASGSDWGSGGRYVIYMMYELGGLYEDQYATLCGHSSGSDSTTIQEQADYVCYTISNRIDLAKSIFGDKAFLTEMYNEVSPGDIVSAAVRCHQYLRENGYTFAESGLTIPEGVENGNTIDCSSYVSWVLYCAGWKSEFEGLQEGDFAGTYGDVWEEVSLSEALPGDIVIYKWENEKTGDEDGHVEIIADVGNGLKLRVYNCGGDKSIQSEGIAGFPESSMSYYYKSQIHMILRPTK